MMIMKTYIVFSCQSDNFDNVKDNDNNVDDNSDNDS